MKNSYTAFIALVFTAICQLPTANCFSQAPQSFNYQAVARNATGAPLVNSSVAVRISIHDGSAGGPVVYSERLTATTNAFGLFTASIGTGNVISGTFAAVDWADADKYMQVELDPTGGSSYTDMGTTQLLSVPYALYAKSSGGSFWNSNGTDIYNANSGNVGIGNSTPASALHIYTQFDGDGIYLQPVTPGDRMGISFFNTVDNIGNLVIAGSAGDWIPTSAANDFILKNASPNALILGTDDTERMRISGSGSVGIGTALPAQLLHIFSESTNVGMAIDAGAVGRARLGLLPGGIDNGELGFKNDLQIGSIADNSLVMTNEWVRITGTGNVGIGTSSPTEKLHIVNANTSTLASQLVIEANSNYGSPTYAAILFNANAQSSAVGPAGRVYATYQNNNYTSATTTFQTITSGPAFVDVMSLQNGNVGIGTTTPGYRFTVKGTGNEVYSVWSEDGTQTADNFTFQIGPGGGTPTTRLGYLMGNFGQSSLGFMIGNTRNAPLRFGIGAGPTEVMRIVPGGNVGIGTTTPAYRLTVVGDGYFSNLVTMANGLNVTGTSAAYVINGTCTITNGNGITGTASVGSSAYGISGVSSSGWAGHFAGNVYYSGVLSGPSDERLKENIKPMTNALGKVMLLEPSTFNFKNEYSKMNLAKGAQLGFMAQNLEQVYPELVVETYDKLMNPDKLFEFKSVNYVGMIPVLTKAIQEQQALIEQLQQQVDELKKK